MLVFCRSLALIACFVLPFTPGCQCDTKEKKAANFSADSSTFALLFTTNIQGYVEPCGCTPDPLGGIGRLAAVTAEANRAFSDRVLLVDAGNLLFDSPKPRADADRCQDEARIDLLLSTLHRLGLVGTVSGPLDDVRGEEFRKLALLKHQIPLLDSSPMRGIVVDRAGVRIGIIGFRLESSDNVKTIQETLRRELDRFKLERTNINVVIAQAPVLLTKEVVLNIDDIDVVIQGRDTGERPLPPEALKPQGPWLVSASMQGQYLGVLEFRYLKDKDGKKWVLDDRIQRDEQRQRLLSERMSSLKQRIALTTAAAQRDFLSKRLKDVEAELSMLESKRGKYMPLLEPHIVARHIALHRGIVPEPKAQTELTTFEKSIPTLVAKCEAGIVCEAPKPNEATYVGVESCKTCHQQAVDVWEKAIVTIDGKDSKGAAIKRKSGHTKAWHTLEEMQKTADRSCIGCHSIGFMQPGGYCKASEVAFRKNVQCESCHGPGSLHAASGDKRLIRREVPESVCRSCHHVPHIPTTDSFVYTEKVQLILGEGHGHALLMRLKHGDVK